MLLFSLRSKTKGPAQGFICKVLDGSDILLLSHWKAESRYNPLPWEQAEEEPRLLDPEKTGELRVRAERAENAGSPPTLPEAGAPRANPHVVPGGGKRLKVN